MNKWVGGVAVVTGASSGIGRCISVRFAEDGMKVAALGRQVDKLEELEKEAGSKGVKIQGYICDVTKEHQVKETFSKIEEELGKIRVLVNSAGVAPYTSLKDIDIEKWRLTFDVNVFGMFTCIKYVVNSVKKSDPGLVHIINMNSLDGHYPPESIEALVYTASKHSITHMTRGLLRYIAKSNLHIKVTSLSPGNVESEMPERGGWDLDITQWPHIHPKDIADQAILILQSKEPVIISELTVKPVGEYF